MIDGDSLIQKAMVEAVRSRIEQDYFTQFARNTRYPTEVDMSKIKVAGVSKVQMKVDQNNEWADFGEIVDEPLFHFKADDPNDLTGKAKAEVVQDEKREPPQLTEGPQ